MKYPPIKSKKAQISEALILLAVISLCSYSFYAAYSFQEKYSKSLSVPTALVSAYNEQNAFEIYSKDAARISINNAFSKVLRLDYDCKTIANENVPIWNGNCLSKDKFEEDFRKEVDVEFKKMLNSEKKYKIILGEDIKFEFEPIVVNISGANYSGTYQYQTIFSINNPIQEGPVEIYGRLLTRMGDCINSSIYETCINKIVFEDYTVNCSSSKYLICSLKTKDNYFFNNSFGKIESKFAVEI